MPAGVDERLWEKAKKAAEEQGRKDDYAYIMGIYKKMSGGKGLKKAMETSQQEYMKSVNIHGIII